MGSSNKGFIWLIGGVILIILIPLIFSSSKSKEDDEYEVEPELHVEQIWFKNIEVLDSIPIDQSLLIQDEITYYFIDKNKNVEEVELQADSFVDLGDGKIQFKAKYDKGAITVKVDKDKVIIEE